MPSECLHWLQTNWHLIGLLCVVRNKQTVEPLGPKSWTFSILLVFHLLFSVEDKGLYLLPRQQLNHSAQLKKSLFSSSTDYVQHLWWFSVCLSSNTSNLSTSISAIAPVYFLPPSDSLVSFKSCDFRCMYLCTGWLPLFFRRLDTKKASRPDGISAYLC